MVKKHRPDADPNAETVPRESSTSDSAEASDEDIIRTEVFTDAQGITRPREHELNHAETGTLSPSSAAASSDPAPLDKKEESSEHDLSPTSREVANSDFEILQLMSGLERYSDLQLIGQGSFGAVLKAIDNVLGRPVAIKVLRDDPPAGFEVCFQTEARRLANLEHPGICQVFDFGTQEGRPYFITEWLSGESLAEMKKPMDWQSACNLVADVAEAMAYAHRQEVVHRDLKPANVMVDAHGKIRVIDFGLALDNSELLQTREDYCGSPAYMSPEQVSGQVHLLDARVDIWAMGVMLYELMTGNRPFRGRNSSDVLIKIRNKPVAPPRTFQPEIPDRIERIILNCLAKQPDDRVTTASDLAHQLRASVADDGGAAVTDSGTAAPATAHRSAEVRSQRSLVRQPLLWLVLLAVCTGGVAILANWDRIRPTPANAAPSRPAGADLTLAAARPNSHLTVRGLRTTTGQRWIIDAEHPKSPSIDTGDRVSLSIQLDQPRHIYLVWIGTDTGTTFLHPGPPGTTVEIGNPEVDRPLQTLELPIGTITATPSTETVLLIAPLRSFDGPDDLERLIVSLPKPDLTRVVAAGMFRGIHFDAHQWTESDSTSPQVREALQRTTQYLRQELGADTIIQAVSFASGVQPAN